MDADSIFPIMNAQDLVTIHPKVEIQRCISPEPCKRTIDIVKMYNTINNHPADSYKFIPYDPNIENCGRPKYFTWIGK
jgi:hypothetical protein